eukprot:9074081-Heterocapsa_arctica.AAC.1
MVDCKIVMSPDADLSGDMATAKSTSGLWLEVLLATGVALEAPRLDGLEHLRSGVHLHSRLAQGRGAPNGRPVLASSRPASRPDVS